MRRQHCVRARQQLRVDFRLALEHVDPGAAAIQCSRSARASAASSTTGPRAVLIRIAVGFIIRSSASPIEWRVTSFNGTWMLTKSDSA